MYMIIVRADKLSETKKAERELRDAHKEELHRKKAEKAEVSIHEPQIGAIIWIVAFVELFRAEIGVLDTGDSKVQGYTEGAAGTGWALEEGRARKA